MALTSRQINIIKSTAPTLRASGDDITRSFYEDIFDKAPEMNNAFNRAAQDSGHQAHAVAMILYAYATHIDDLGTLDPAFQKICNIHASIYIAPDLYPLVGKFLLDAMARVAASTFTQEVIEAWAAAYNQLASIFIQHEKKFYEKPNENAWSSWRDMRIIRKVPESDVITSFYFQPVDGQPLPEFLPGQFISIKVNVPELNYLQLRQYSLSDAPGLDFYRLSIKREEGAKPGSPGYVSNILHDSKQVGDILQMSHPQGEFFLDDRAYDVGPVVLLSAGVGITPTMSMLNHLLRTGSQRPISFIHGARNRKVRAFHDYLTDVAETNTNVRYVGFLKNGVEEEKSPQPIAGRLDLSKLDAGADLYLSDTRTQYFVCGPESFMTDVCSALSKIGVDAPRIQKETFGPGEWLAG